MRNSPALVLAMTAALMGGPAGAQQTAALPPEAEGGPMSAIDWLSDSISAPPAPPREPEVSDGAGVGEVTVAPLGATVADAVGLLPVAVTGLPAGLWGESRPEDLARRLREAPADMLPALRAALFTLLLAELAPPNADLSATGPDGDQVFLARIDKLLELGALEPAAAMLARAGSTSPEILRRRFDVALLLGTEDEICQIIDATPGVTPTFPARIFCLARAGDWSGAVLLMGTGRALDLITAEEDALIARFLDPELFEGEPPLPQPARPSPLTFRMFEAIGEPIPSTTLPLAFAHSDLRPTMGWKARIEAAERLSRTGAVSANQLLGLYTERRPAASGGVWDRVAAVQALDTAMSAGDREALEAQLPGLWTSLTAAELEVPIARIYGARLAAMELGGRAGDIAFQLGLLSDNYAAVARSAQPGDLMGRFLVGLATGRLDGLPAPDPRAQAVLDGFLAEAPPARLASLIEGDRQGEALLRALDLFMSGTWGNLDEITDAIAYLRATGLEETARRAAIEYLVLERRG